MALKAKYKNKSDIPEAVLGLYVEKDGEWVLDAEIEDHPSVAGLKNTVAATRTEREKLKEQLKKYEGLDLDTINKVLEEHAKLEEGELLKKGDIEGIVAKRVEAMRKENEKVINELTGKYNATSDRLRTLTIDAGLTKAAAAIGVKASAMEDFLARGQRVFRLDEQGNAVPYDKDNNPIFGKDGRTPMTPDEWAQSIIGNIPHLLEPSSGGGANNQGQRPVTPGLKVIQPGDQAAFNANLEAIAKGEVRIG